MIVQSFDWQSLTTVKKGNIGEKLVDQWLTSKGYIPYSPIATGAHPFDRLVASRDKKTIFIADSKTKAKRKYYPDTGIDIRHYKEYMHIQQKHNIHVFIFFVDEESMLIYGNFLARLDKSIAVYHKNKKINYPLLQHGIIYFPMVSMIEVCPIPKETAELMCYYTTKNDRYKPNV
jgi:hypothetical protein